MLYMVTFTINIPQMLAYIPYMDPMGILGISQSVIIHEEILEKPVVGPTPQLTSWDL